MQADEVVFAIVSWGSVVKESAKCCSRQREVCLPLLGISSARLAVITSQKLVLVIKRSKEKYLNILCASPKVRGLKNLTFRV